MLRKPRQQSQDGCAPDARLNLAQAQAAAVDIHDGAVLVIVGLGTGIESSSFIKAMPEEFVDRQQGSVLHGRGRGPRRPRPSAKR